MKKMLLIASSALVVVSALGQTSENVGLDQLSSISPAPGTVNLNINESGLSAINFNFKEKAEVSRDKDLFITMTHNGNVISNVPASNTKLISYDGIYADVWQVSFFLTPKYECREGGDYQITIPEGFFLVGGSKTPNKEIVVNYNIPNSTISIYPPESRECTFLQDFIVTFGNAKSIEVNPDASHAIEFIDLFGGSTIVDDGGDDDEPIDPSDNPSFEYSLSIQDNTLTVHLLETITNGSTYDLSIPAGFLNLISENGEVTQNEDMYYQYVIPKYGKGQPEIVNVESILLDFPGVIELQLSQDEELKFVNNMGKCSLVVINEDGSEGDVIADYRAAAKNSKYYKDENGNPIPENAHKVFLVNRLGEDVRICPTPGLYQLQTTNGLYTAVIDGKNVNVSPFKYTFEVVDGDLFDMQFEPENGTTVESIKEIKVTFPRADEIVVEWGTAWLKSSTTIYQFFPQGNIENGNTVVFKTSVPVTMPGIYRFTSDIKSVNVDGDFVGICADYEVNDLSGVGTIQNVVILPEVFDIYNAQGMIIKRNSNISELNSLPAGIYIAGGRKIVNR